MVNCTLEGQRARLEGRELTFGRSTGTPRGAGVDLWKIDERVDGLTGGRVDSNERVDSDGVLTTSSLQSSM